MYFLSSIKHSAIVSTTVEYISRKAVATSQPTNEANRMMNHDPKLSLPSCPSLFELMSMYENSPVPSEINTLHRKMIRKPTELITKMRLALWYRSLKATKAAWQNECPCRHVIMYLHIRQPRQLSVGLNAINVKAEMLASSWRPQPEVIAIILTHFC